MPGTPPALPASGMQSYPPRGHHICTAPAPLLLLRQYRGADNCLVNGAGGLLSGHGRAWLLLPCPAGDERSQFTLGALWLRCPLHCALGWGLY